MIINTPTSLAAMCCLSFSQVDETTYRTTIENVNQCFDEAEALGCCNVLEGCLACMTGFALHYCFKTHYERVSYCLCETGVNRSHCMYVLARLLYLSEPVKL